jgi:hypothetical protein
VSAAKRTAVARHMERVAKRVVPSDRPIPYRIPEDPAAALETLRNACADLVRWAESHPEQPLASQPHSHPIKAIARLLPGDFVR